MNKIDAIKQYLEELIHSLPAELVSNIKVLDAQLEALNASTVAAKEAQERAVLHQQQAQSNLANALETIRSIQEHSVVRLCDAGQKLNLVAALIKGLEVEGEQDGIQDQD